MKKSHTSATHRTMKMMQMVMMLLCHNLLLQRNAGSHEFQRGMLNIFENPFEQEPDNICLGCCYVEENSIFYCDNHVFWV